MFQRLPIALTLVKVGNKSENSLNEIRQMIYSLYIAKETTKQLFNNMILNISLVFITQSYFAVPNNIRLNSTH